MRALTAKHRGCHLKTLYTQDIIPPESLPSLPWCISLPTKFQASFLPVANQNNPPHSPPRDGFLSKHGFMREAYRPGLLVSRAPLMGTRAQTAHFSLGSAGKETTTLNRWNWVSTDLPALLQHVPHPKSLSINQVLSSLEKEETFARLRISLMNPSIPLCGLAHHSGLLQFPFLMKLKKQIDKVKGLYCVARWDVSDGSAQRLHRR